MKKLLVIAGLAAFSFASAQQKDIFDIQKYLQKKQAEEKLQKMKDRFIPSNPSNPKFYLPESLYPPQARLSQTLPNGNKIYLLPMDNMPCIVPDKDQYADNMPPAPKKFELFDTQQRNNRQQPGAIPNPAYPWKIIPDDNNK
jgi:hypothetical protein